MTAFCFNTATLPSLSTPPMPVCSGASGKNHRLWHDRHAIVLHDFQGAIDLTDGTIPRSHRGVNLRRCGEIDAAGNDALRRTLLQVALGIYGLNERSLEQVGRLEVNVAQVGECLLQRLPPLRHQGFGSLVEPGIGAVEMLRDLDDMPQATIWLIGERGSFDNTIERELLLWRGDPVMRTQGATEEQNAVDDSLIVDVSACM